jgi:hypothetical protein
MICFDIELNGKHLCRAGVGDSGSIYSSVVWVGGSPHSPKRGGRTKAGVLELGVTGGLGSLERQIHRQWVERRLRPGDTVSIKIVSAKSADRPRREQVITTASTRDLERRHYLELKRKFEPGAKRTIRGRKVRP